MPYKCPRCGNPVQRGYSSTAQISAGLVGALFYAAFGSFQCKTCGKIKRSEFSAEDRTKMVTWDIIMVISALAILVTILSLNR